MATSQPTIDELKLANERLTLQKANAQLEAELDAMKVPWWRKLPWVASVTTILAATVPVTTAVHGCYRNSRELALAERKQSQELALADNKQAHEIQLTYFKTYQEPGERQRTLRFVLATARDKSVKRWAATELGVVGAELKTLDDRIAELKKQLEDKSLPEDARIELIQELIQLQTQREEKAHLPKNDWPVKGKANAGGQGAEG